MGHTFGDGLIVAAIAGAVIAYMYFRHVERRRRLEIIHQERLAAMDKGIPLPELPLDPERVPRARDPRELLIHGIAWLALGIGGIVALRFGPWSNGPALWPLSLPLAFLGLGLIIFHVLASDRRR